MRSCPVDHRLTPISVVGWPPEDVATLPSTWDVNRWEGLNLYFGGVQAVHASEGALEAAGDPRRGGAGVVVE